MAESRRPPSDPSAPVVERNWMRTYVSVMVVEVLVLLGLLWLQSHFGI
jgi:hypothetical protein